MANLRTVSLGCVAVCSALLAVGCAGNAIEGVLQDEHFTLVPNESVAHRGDDLVFVLCDAGETRLRCVSVALPSDTSVGVVPVDDGLEVEVTDGAIVREDRGDGVMVVSHDAPLRAHALSGDVDIERIDGDEAAGTLHVALDDGGYADGEFLATFARD